MASVQVDSIGKEVEEACLGYKYKDTLQISLLGLVDDLIGVTEAGFKAAQLNEVLNLKTAEKYLQFGVSKCKSMFVGKLKEQFLDSEMFVDQWKVEYKNNINTGTEEIIESYVGQVPIGKTDKQKYLGFVISGSGNNFDNITAVKQKSIGIIRKIINKLECLNLLNYYFECAIIFMHVMLRPSILYASETYYNLTESQTRQLERIEEGYLRQILVTGRGCPIVQLYLEVGVIPARFEIQRYRLLFLKSILQEEPSSRVSKFFNLQLNQPTRGDWVSTCLKDLKTLKITESLEEIKVMTKGKYNRMLKERIHENALKYLTEKQVKKGKEITYSKIEMAEYLLPDSKLSTEQKRQMFSIRNKMIDISDNFSSSEVQTFCYCGEQETMSHLYYCKLLNDDSSELISYQKIYDGNISEQMKIFHRFEVNLKIRENIHIKENIDKHPKKKDNERRNKKRKIPPCDPLVDPLHCKKYSNG